jgi:hypothetical protein
MKLNFPLSQWSTLTAEGYPPISVTLAFFGDMKSHEMKADIIYLKEDSSHILMHKCCYNSGAFTSKFWNNATYLLSRQNQTVCGSLIVSEDIM